ncbi:glycosyltransferase family 2 protein [Cohnella thermotolerans]|uniref:glycosyltransferase family 2 protein n=1 Tax=Cohnella thermotolerans TaxID=329858 RepID=UPI00047AD7B4|nr:hypothetical protein [Cohnella thermotolerans]
MGFCLLFRRELFRRIGYFDEGFELGNFENDDFNIRVRMLEKALVIAEDTFIHHYGSVSMKALGDRFTLVNDRNHRYFLDKWQNPYEWIHRVLQLAHEKKQPVPDMTALYFRPASAWIRIRLSVSTLPLGRTKTNSTRFGIFSNPIRCKICSNACICGEY